MPHIAPLSSQNCQEAAADIQWLASATGFTANSMLSLAHRPDSFVGVHGYTDLGPNRTKNM